MDITLARSWPTLVWRGVAAISFGLIALVWPGATLLSLTFLFAAYAFCDGILALVAAARGDVVARHRWLLFLDGMLGIAAAIVAVVWPGVTLLFLLGLVAVRLFILGVTQIAAGIDLDMENSARWLCALAGAAAILGGMAMLAYPIAGVVALLGLLAAFGLVFGALMIAAGFRLRTLTRSLEGITRAT